MRAKKGSVGQTNRWVYLRWLRRGVQAASLLFFLFLIQVTVSTTGAQFDADSVQGVKYPVEFFLNIDPLAGLLVALSTWSIPKAMLLSLIVLSSALLLGRCFCGWICPMGTMNHLASEIGSVKTNKQRMRANRTQSYQIVKYFLLIAVLISALFGSASLGGWLDPLCMATRGVALTVVPLVQWIFGSILTSATETNFPGFQKMADIIYDGTGSVLLPGSAALVSGGIILSIVFIGVLVANRFIPRFWCRGLCPLGALLGLASRFSLFTLYKEESSCTHCGKCQFHCSGAASPMEGDSWQRAECDLCMNCVSDCPHDSLRFGASYASAGEKDAPDLGRRAVLASAAVGAVMVPVARTGSLCSFEGRPNPECIRPPGSLDERNFLARCIRCGQCMKICPNNALHPSLEEAGFEGLWSPVLVPRIGYCEPTCTLCTQVCPTGAIHRVTAGQKVGSGEESMVRIGTAFINRGRCLPWAMNTSCIVCEEFCPIAPKAIQFTEHQVLKGGKTVELKRPHVDPAQCNGCGACEHVCPVHDRAAICVSSSGETRSSENQLLLSSGTKKIK